uniref:Uncharacterized protein n=1 Tax=Neobodo designis TaxID=312471 RepID=A0A7S1LY51_NEODS
MNREARARAPSDEPSVAKQPPKRSAPAWGTPGPAAEGSGRYGVVVGAFRVRDRELARRGTGFLSDVLLFVRVADGTGPLAADVPAAAWTDAGIDSPSAWVAQALALCQRHHNNGTHRGAAAADSDTGGDLAVVPLSDARAIRTASDRALVDHLLRAAPAKPKQHPAQQPQQSRTPDPKATGGASTLRPTGDPSLEMARVLGRRRRREMTRYDADRAALAKAAGLDWSPPP